MARWMVFLVADDPDNSDVCYPVPDQDEAALQVAMYGGRKGWLGAFALPIDEKAVISTERVWEVLAKVQEAEYEVLDEEDEGLGNGV